MVPGNWSNFFFFTFHLQSRDIGECGCKRKGEETNKIYKTVFFSHLQSQDIAEYGSKRKGEETKKIYQTVFFSFYDTRDQ